MYASVLLFTSGIGILIYKILIALGMSTILALLLLLVTVFFYFCFKTPLGLKTTNSI
jgi:hypothetical protein